jgi:murein DD-endopeptidase MepM/ murein hydrolase activator NlpD
MRTSSMRFRGALLARCAAVAAIGAFAAACSSDVTRFDSNPFNNRSETTASIPQQQNQAQVPGHQLPQRNHVETQPLNNPQQTTYRPTTVPATQAPQAKNQQLNAPRTTAAVNTNDWAWDGGKAVTVQQGETVYSLSRKHNVPAEVILKANNLQSASMIQPGQRLVIPARKNANAPMLQNAPVANTAANVHTTTAGDTIFSLSRKYKVSPQAIASANNMTLATQLKIGQQVRIPATAPIANTPATQPQPQMQRNVQTVPQTQTQQIVQNENTPAPENVGVVRPNTPPAVTEAPRANTGPNFHWPVRGRILSAYGKKPNGQQNDGINVSVPDGTPIRASEDGVVAYAGNELKGFGNLVLIRHADNWVTAYAHLGTLDVKKDQKVKRGDIIARAGQTGGVTSPQLHFEIRKGSSPVDPEKHLSGI